MPFLTKFTKPSLVSQLWTKRTIHEYSPFPRQDYSVCEILDNLYIFAGSIEDVPRNDLVIINSRNLSSKVVETTGEIPCPRSGHTALNVGKHIIIFGGETLNSRWDDSLYSFNIESKTWTRLPMQSNSLVGRRDHSAVAVKSIMYLFGGQVDGYYLNDLVAFDTKSLSTQCPRWDYIAPGYESPPERASHSAAVYKDRIYIFGGKDTERFFNDLWCYDPESNTWSQIIADYGPSKRIGHTACICDDLMYILGGQDEYGKFLNEVYAFNLLEETWLDVPSIQLDVTVANSVKACLIHGKIHILVGECNSVYILDTAKGGDDVELHSGENYFSNTQVQQTPAKVYNEQQMRGPPGQVEGHRGGSTYNLEISRLLTPSPVLSEPNPIKGSSGQGSGNVSHINRVHSTSQLQAPSNYILNSGKHSDTKTCLNSRAPAQQLNPSSDTIKCYNTIPLSISPPSGSGPLEFKNYQQSSLRLGEATTILVTTEESKVQLATFVPLSPEKVQQFKSTEPEMARAQVLKQTPPVKNFPSSLENTLKYTGGIRAAESLTTFMNSDFKPSSPTQSVPVLETYSEEKNYLTNGFKTSEDTSAPTTKEKVVGHVKNSSTYMNMYPEKIHSIFEENLSSEFDGEEEETHSRNKFGTLEKIPVAQFPPDTETFKTNKEPINYSATSKVVLWNNVQKTVSEKAEYLTKEGSTLPNLKSLQKEQSDPEKIKLLQALLLLKEQLSKAQVKVAQNCEYAAQRISDGEKHRQVALQEAAYLRMKISAMNSSSTESLCKIEQDRIIELEKRLAKALAENQSLLSKIDLQAQASAKDHENRLLAEESSKNNLNRAIEAENSCRVVKEKFATLEDTLKKTQQAVSDATSKASKAEATLHAKETESTVILERLASLEETSAQEMQTRELASNVVNAANERANEAERMWMDAQQEIQALEKESIELRKTIEQKSEELARTHFQAGEMETLWLNTKQQLEALDSISQVFHNSKNHSEGGIEEKLTRANYRITELEAELNLLRKVKEDSRDVIEKLESDNFTLTQKMEDLEKRHHDGQSDLSELRLRLADAQDNVYEMKLQLMNSQDLLRAESEN
ncbi:hypothetical protein K7432_011176 [Basidiobolus ranarum]|uniref:Uncharacterized protein n=1 Tax=Basidiobolus ranarum TaxID=34480 RepID=A0ABR2VUB4_9FUNG